MIALLLLIPRPRALLRLTLRPGALPLLTLRPGALLLPTPRHGALIRLQLMVRALPQPPTLLPPPPNIRRHRFPIYVSSALRSSTNTTKNELLDVCLSEKLVFKQADKRVSVGRFAIRSILMRRALSQYLNPLYHLPMNQGRSHGIHVQHFYSDVAEKLANLERPAAPRYNVVGGDEGSPLPTGMYP